MKRYIRLITGFVIWTFISVNISVAGEKIYKIHCDSTPPYTFKDESSGIVTGLWVETVRSVMKRLGESHEKIEIFKWARVKQEGFDGKIDGVFGSQINDERLQYMRFPKETISTETWVFWIRKTDGDKLKYASFEDLKGKLIGLVTGYNYPKEFVDFVEQEAFVERVSTETQNFKKLAEGRIDYTVSLLHIGSWIAAKEGLSEMVTPLVNKSLFTSDFYIMFNKKNVSREWVDRFSDELAEYKKSEEYRKLPERFGLIVQ